MRAIVLLVTTLFVLPSAASAQELSDAERASAVARARALATCLGSHHAQLERILALIDESQRQRDVAREARVRNDAELAIESLVARAATVQRQARGCAEGEALPSPGTRVIQRGPPPDENADSVAQTGGTVRVIERDAPLTELVHVVRGEQVDGQGRLEDASVRAAVRSIGPRLDRCYQGFLRRGSLEPRSLDLVFGFGHAGAAREVAVERSGFGDSALETCVRAAGRSIRTSVAPRGGEATFSYSLRFGRENPRR